MDQTEAGKHGFDGACAPENTKCRFETFSVSVFQWIPKASGRGLKRGTAKVRVKGSTDRPEIVFAKAREIAAALDAGTYTGPKNVVT